MKEIVLAHMGGPSSAAELGLFLKNIFLDRELLSLPAQPVTGRLLALARRGRSRANYERAGWSPVGRLTESLAAKLNARLNPEGMNVRALYTHLPPYIEQAAEGALVVPLYPQFSSALGGAMRKRLPGRKVAGPWHDDPAFLSLLAEGVRKSLAGAGPEGTALMFIAHGVPAGRAAGDVYPGQIEAMYKELSARFRGYACSLSFIGKAGPGEWTGPYAADVIRKMTGVRRIVAAYLSFPLDNIEVLHDIDTSLRGEALRRGITEFSRAALPNDSDELVSVLEQVIRRHL